MATQLASATDQLWDRWPYLSHEQRLKQFRELHTGEKADFFLALNAHDQYNLLVGLPEDQRHVWMRLLAPDDAADVIQQAAPEEREKLLALLDEPTRKEVVALLAYKEDEAGGLMNPRFARLRPDTTVDVAISYLRKEAPSVVQMYYAYVLDQAQHLLGVVSLRQLFRADPGKLVQDVMTTKDLVSVAPETDQEEVSRVVRDSRLLAVPVLEADRRMVGIVTVDDIVDVVEEQASRDIQNIGGMEALDTPYMHTGLLEMVRKRAGWLAILFVGEMFTATAMSFFEEEIAKAVVLALFLPLIISSGGNSGSQATSLIIQAMALGRCEVARLVSSDPQRTDLRPRAGRDSRRHRTHAHLRLAESLRNLRRANAHPGAHNFLRSDWRGCFRDNRRLDVAFHSTATRPESSECIGSIRGDAGGCHRPRHLLHHRQGHHAESLR